MTWKGANDRKIRKYDYGYDAVSRLTGAKFGQLTGSAFSNATVKYDVSNLTYDGNGNILTMYQYGLKASGSSAAIDQLLYSYKPGSNKLKMVADLAASTAADHLGDFQDGGLTAVMIMLMTVTVILPATRIKRLPVSVIIS